MTDTFNPDWAICPGETIKEYCEKKNQALPNINCYNLLYNHLELTPTRFISLLTGVETITEKIADLLAEVFEDTTPEFWLKLEQQFVDDLNRNSITRNEWVKMNSGFRLYKATVTTEVYFVASQSEAELTELSVDPDVEDIIRESINDSISFDSVDVELVESKKDVNMMWKNALPYMHPDVVEDPILSCGPERTCLQVLQCTGVIA